MAKEVVANGIFISSGFAYDCINQFMRSQGATDLNYGSYTGGPSIPYANEIHQKAIIWVGEHQEGMYVLVNALIESGTRVEVTTSNRTASVSRSLIDKLKGGPLQGFEVQEVRDCAAD